MTTRTISRWAGAIAVAASLLALGAPPAQADGPVVAGQNDSATVTDAQAPAWKQQILALHDKLASGTMTATDVAAYNAIMDAHAPSSAPRLSAATLLAAASTAGGIAPMSLYTAYDVAATQYPQERTNWCGPAAAKSIVVVWSQVDPIFHPDTKSHLDGQSLSQSALSGSSYTGAGTSGGTNWSPGGMQKALNNWLFGQPTGQYANYTPTSATTLQQHVTADIDVDWMVAADTREHLNGPHFNNHPNKDISHWTSIRGYDSSGSMHHYQDPAANTTVLGSSWSNVKPYFSMSAANGWSYMTQQGMTYGIVW